MSARSFRWSTTELASSIDAEEAASWSNMRPSDEAKTFSICDGLLAALVRHGPCSSSSADISPSISPPEAPITIVGDLATLTALECQIVAPISLTDFNF